MTPGDVLNHIATRFGAGTAFFSAANHHFVAGHFFARRGALVATFRATLARVPR
jgi:hypothetical protein